MIKSEIACILDKYPVIALAVSGGSDSMAMAEWFRQNRPKGSFFVINIDHHIRGEESKRDSDFVQEYCVTHGIEYKKFDVDAVAFAAQNGYTLEQAARILRHDIFEKVAFRYANVVATAHHAQDQAESIFMHIARGCGVGGLVGMSVEDGHIIRPLLGTSKSEIMQYISDNALNYCEDSTNADDSYSRNFVRNKVMPLVKQCYPTFDSNLLGLSKRAGQVVDFIDQCTPCLSVSDGGVRCDFEGNHIVICTEMIRRAFSLLGVSADIEQRHIDLILDFAKGGSGSLDMPYDTKVYKCEKGVFIAKNRQYNLQTYRFSQGFFDFGGFELSVQRIAEMPKEIKAEMANSDIEKCLYIAVDNEQQAVIRARQRGDKINKFGGGSKSLGDYLTDKKVDVWLRDRLPIIAQGDNVLCVCGVDIASDAKVLSTSKQIYKIKLTRLD